MATTPAASKAGYIYALSQDGVVKYVGQAKDLKKRYGQHCSLAQNMGKTKKQLWLQALLLTGQQPAITSLEKTDDMDSSEIAWMEKLKGQGIELLNMADGGQSMGHLRRAKQNKPWGSHYSPVQHVLMMMRDSIRACKTYGTQEQVEHCTMRYNEVVQTINRIGKDEMNRRMWERDGDSYYAR